MVVTRTLVAVGTLAAAAGAVGLGLRGGDRSAPAELALSTSGAVEVGNSREGQAILVARGLTPGQSAEGTVTISNAGDAPGSTRLAPTDLVDVPGPGGELLSQRMVLEVTDAAGGT